MKQLTLILVGGLLASLIGCGGSTTSGTDNGTSNGTVCTANAARCTDAGDLEVCAADGSGWQLTDCTDGCEDVAGTSRCRSDVPPAGDDQLTIASAFGQSSSAGYSAWVRVGGPLPSGAAASSNYAASSTP